MHRISSTARITLGLSCLSVTILLAAQMIGLIPDRRSAIVAGRASLCESVAIHCSMLAGKRQMAAMHTELKTVLECNPDVVYAAVRRSHGTIVIEVKDPNCDIHWPAEETNESYMAVPLTANSRPWGTVEIGFRPMGRSGVIGLLTSRLVLLCLFVSSASTVIYFIYMRKLLQHLDPSKVVPDRVRATLDTMVEGLLVLDDHGRIVLANQSFAATFGRSSDELVGKRASELPWANDSSDNDVTSYPWIRAVQEGTSQVGVALGLQIHDGNHRSFVVNSSPIAGEDGKTQGVLASFDDVTLLEKNRVELERMLESLKKSRDEVHLKNQELQLLATLDPLTTCLNRRSFFEKFEEHWSNSLRYDYSVGCVMLDIDHFKSINDACGHSVGDQVLQKVADSLKETVRDGDVVCRYGGEEFCIIMPHVDLDGTTRAAERLREAVEASSIDGLSVTSSFGAAASGLGARDPQELIDQADKCLYLAKQQGRNCVRNWGEIPEDFQIAESENLPTSPAAPSPHRTTIPFHAVTALVSALAYRDAGTAEHSRRVADLCVALASKMVSASEAYVIEIGGLLHDIGKIGVPDAILLKPGPLTDEEWKVMGLHDRIGVGIIQSSFACAELTAIVESHHSWFGGHPRDPDLPTGNEIPIGARILALADAYDAMVSDRVYRKGRSQQEAFEELRRCAGVQFDPDLVEPFIESVLSRDGNRGAPTPRVSKQAALNIGLQIESLAYSVDQEDDSGLADFAAALKETAMENGVSGIVELAEELEAAANGNAERLELVQLTNEMLELCRATQTAYLSDEDPDVLAPGEAIENRLAEVEELATAYVD